MYGGAALKLKNTYSVESIVNQPTLLPTGQAVINGGSAFHLNTTGAWALRELEQDLDFDTLVRRAEQYFDAKTDAERARLRADFTAFVGQLRQLGVLEE